MSKMAELSAMIDDLIACGETLTKTGFALRNFYADTSAGDPAAEKKAPAGLPKEKPAPKQYSKEDVRGILAKKAAEADGKFRTDVKALVKKYGNGGSLTSVDAKDYAALVAEAEGLGGA